MNYKIVGEDYIADEGFVFVNKTNGATGKIMCLSDETNIDNYDIVEYVVAVGKRFLSEAKEQKLEEMSAECNRLIVNGFDVDLNGEIVHFSLTAEDQINLLSSSMAAVSGQQLIPYHIDGVLCKFYSPEDIQKIVTAATNLKTYHTTYYNSLKDYILSLSDEEVTKIYYGVEIPENHRSEVLKAIYAQMSGLQ